MQFDELMKGLGARIGIELSEEDHVCTLGVDDMVVTIMDLDDVNSLVITSEIGEPPPQGLEKLYRAMLEANHNFQGTAGATISLNAETGRFHLCRLCALAATDVDALYDALERFVNTLEVWKKLIADYRPDLSAEETVPLPGHVFGSGFMSV